MDTPPEAVEPTPGGSDGAAVAASGALSAGGGGGGELTSLPSPAMPAAPPAPPSLPFPRRISTLPPSPATRPTVILNVYNLTVPSPPPSLLAFTSMLASTGLGLHHSGVQVGTTEYAFGGHNDEGTGVFEVRPRAAPGAEFRESIPLGDCVYSATEVREIVRAMGVAWPGAGYNLLTRYVEGGGEGREGWWSTRGGGCCPSVCNVSVTRVHLPAWWGPHCGLPP